MRLLIPFCALSALLPLCPRVIAQDSAKSAPDKPAIPADKDPQKTASGLKYSVLKAGEEKGQHPKRGDTVKVHYTGWLEDGTVFDSSVQRGQPAEFVLGKVIEGWNEAVPLMTKGASLKVTLPPELGYGESGAGALIKPGATLIFQIELLDFTPGQALPTWPAAHADKQKKSDSGLVTEWSADGQGEPIGADTAAEIRFAFWNEKKQLVDCSEYGSTLFGTAKAFSLKFLGEILPQMRVGSRVRCEVPAELGFGKQPRGALLPAGSVTTWELAIVRKVEVPTFSMSDDSKVTKTKSGLKYEVLKEGTGKTPTADDQVLALYTGWTTDGKMFDSAHQRGQPSGFPLRTVIPGWTEGLQLMKEGAIYKFTIPPELGYGAQGTGKDIPPNATLVFVVELVKVGR